MQATREGEEASRAGTRYDAPLVGVVARFERGEAWVEFPGSGAAPRKARLAASVEAAALAHAAQRRQEVLLMFEGADPGRPVLLALLQSETPALDQLLTPLPFDQAVVRVDGRRVSIEGEQEVVLRCGKASLTLTHDGRVTLRGVNIVSQADQVQKIRGGVVKIN